MFDPLAIRRQFPIFDHPIDGHPLIYLDTAATSQKPRAVLEAMQRYYEEANGNPHRGMHILAERATIAFENARKTVQKFLNAKRTHEIIFTKNCTEAMNLVAKSWGRSHLKKGDTVVLSVLEHHSNIVPWLQLKEEIGINVEWIGMDDEGQLKLEDLDQFLRKGNVKLVSITAQSNVLGVRPPIREIVRKVHDAGALVCIDAAQHVAHHHTDVQDLDCDFLAFSSHKIYGPTGIGVLYAKEKILEQMPPLLGGGGMIQEVHRDHFTPADIPERFEAGTQPVAEAVGLAAAIHWLSQFPWKDIEEHEASLIKIAYEELSKIPQLTILGPRDPSNISGCLSFVIDGIHPHDLTEMLGRKGICLRAGHHCAQPLHEKLGLMATTRLSMGIYNTQKDLEAAAAACLQ